MLLTILLLNLLLLLSLSDAGADAKFSPKHDLERDLENLVEKLVQSRLRELETRMREEKEKQAKEEKKLEAKIKEQEKNLETKGQEMDRRVKELEDKMKEEKYELEASKLRMKEDGLAEFCKNVSNNSLKNQSLCDLPIVLISAWRRAPILSSQTVTFESFLANFNSNARPEGGDGVLDLDSGVFTCFTPGYYTVSFSVYAIVGPGHDSQILYLYKNGVQLQESVWVSYAESGAVNAKIGSTGSRIVVRNLFENVCLKCDIPIFSRFSTWMQETLWS